MLNRWQRTIVDLRGNVVPYAQLQIRVESTQAAAIIYADRLGTAPLPSGIVTADENGYAFFYAEADLYRISSAEPTIDWRYVDIGSARALQRGNNLSDVTNPATARNNLGLKGAATRDVVSSSTDTSGGNKVVTQGWMGLGSSGRGVVDANTPIDRNEFLAGTGASGINYPGSSFYRGWINTHRAGLNSALFFDHNGVYYRAFDRDKTVQLDVALLHTGNTTVDGNGFIKEASPVIHLYDNKIEMEGFEQETPAFEKVDVGVYRITGTSGLAQEGWYIDTPQDRNGNKYFNVDWEQDTTPELSSDGLLDEPANVTLIIRTFERVWNPDTGVFDNGNPIDINELQSRHIALRFNEVRSESIDDEIERPANPIGGEDVD